MNLLIYGAASLGHILFEKLRKIEDYNILGFIDKRAYEINDFMSLPVYTMEKAWNLYKNLDVVVVISIKNVFEHENIAFALKGVGFEKILFKPKSILEGEENTNDKYINELYDDIIGSCEMH